MFRKACEVQGKAIFRDFPFATYTVVVKVVVGVVIGVVVTVVRTESYKWIRVDNRGNACMSEPTNKNLSCLFT